MIGSFITKYKYPISFPIGGTFYFSCLYALRYLQNTQGTLFYSFGILEGITTFLLMFLFIPVAIVQGVLSPVVCPEPPGLINPLVAGWMTVCESYLSYGAAFLTGGLLVVLSVALFVYARKNKTKAWRVYFGVATYALLILMGFLLSISNYNSGC